MKQTGRRYRERLPHEVFEKLEDLNKIADRVDLLKENGSFAVKTILKGAFDPNIIFDLPDGAPVYKPDAGPAGHQLSPLGKNIRRIAKCLVDQPNANANAKYSKLKKEVIFLGLLEIAHAKDAKILIAMKDKKLNKLYSSLRPSLIRKAFPGLIPD
jgi:hypothetical protein